MSLIKVKIKNTCRHTGVTEGEIYYTKPYWLEPDTKAELVKRVSDDFEPMCNEYWSNLIILNELETKKEIQKAINNYDYNVNKFRRHFTTN